MSIEGMRGVDCGEMAKTSCLTTVRLCLLAALLAATLNACGTGRTADAPPPPSGLIYSPNGEPLSGGPLGHPTCSVAMSQWFDRVDARHDGMIDLEEFLADTRRQFAVMDLNHDGIITPAELYTYRRPFGQDLVFVAAPGAGGKPQGADNTNSDATSEMDRRQRSQQGSGPPNRPDPVMAADVKLRFQVSLADFLAYAQDQFTTLNRSGNGHLTKVEVQRSCGTY